MDPKVVWLTVLLIGGMLLLLPSGMPIAFAMLVPSLLVLFLFGGATQLMQLWAIAWRTATSFVIIAIPLFIFMADVFSESGLAKSLYNSATKWLAALPGGLAIGSVAACAVFSAICGSSSGTAATIGIIGCPEMEERGYDPRLATGAVALGGTLGILIPPSIPMIIIGDMCNLSVGKLFIAGIVPGILNALLMMLFIGIWVKINPRIAPRFPSVPLREKMISLRGVWGSIAIIVVVMGGIYAGVMTPTEAAAVGAFCAIVLMMIMRRGLKMDLLTAAARRSARYTGWIMMLTIGGLTFGYALTLLRIPMFLTEWVATLALNPWVVLILLNLLLVVMGMFMDTLSMLLITIPIMFPMIKSLGFDPIWFVVIFVINCELSNITPPVGVNLFVLQGITKHSFETIVGGVWPLIGSLFLGMALVMAFPQLALFLPNLMIK